MNLNDFIAFVGPDTFVAIILFAACVLKAAEGIRIDPLKGLFGAFSTFFFVLCIVYIMEWGVGLFGMVILPKPLAAFAGLFGFLGSSWLIGLEKDGKSIEEKGASGSLISIVKSIVNFKKNDS